MSGRYFEDFAVGQKFLSGRLRVTKEEIVEFAARPRPRQGPLGDAQPERLGGAGAHRESHRAAAAKLGRG